MTSIEWTDRSWNPVRGCTRVSEGCRNCYAERLASRFSGPGLAFEGFAKRTQSGGRWSGRVALIRHKLAEPLSWRKQHLVFVNSMSDLFHEDLDFHEIAAVFGVMSGSPRQTFQVLTKRPGRMLDFFRWLRWQASDDPSRFCQWQAADAGAPPDRQNDIWPLPNVWLGVSVEDQATADERIPLLLQAPATLRFVSYEPALGPVEFGKYLAEPDGETCYHSGKGRGIDWIIAGGESGPGARPPHPDWFRAARDQCYCFRVPFFFKQWGAYQVGSAKQGQYQTTVVNDGRHFDGEIIIANAELTAAWPTLRAVVMARVGKGHAGRDLDSRTWDQFPEDYSTRSELEPIA